MLHPAADYHSSGNVEGAAAARTKSTLARGLVLFEVGKLALYLVDVVVREVVVTLRLQRVRDGLQYALLCRFRARSGVGPARPKPRVEITICTLVTCERESRSEYDTVSYLNVLVGLVGNIFLTAPEALEPAVDLAMSCVICPIVLVSWRPWSSSDEVCCCINASRSITGCAPGIESRTEKVQLKY